MHVKEEIIMEWLYISPLKSSDAIFEYESLVNYSFPDDFKECVNVNNGAYPKFEVFISTFGKRRRKRVFNNLFSFNKDDPSTIWKYNDWNGRSRDWNMNGEMTNYIAFAKDPFGNLICFDKTDDKIVFVDHETLNVEFVAKSFTEFIESLRKS